jgi:hypothetical protein
MAKQHNMNPHVAIDGRRVTVTFELPFMFGDACISPYHWDEPTTVSLMPEVAIRLHNNLREVECHANGAWYTASHSQLHGVDQFLPDMAAVLDYWLGQKLEFFEDRIGGLRRSFAGQPEALARLTARRIELLRAEIDAEKREMADSVVRALQRVTALEAAIVNA